MNLQEKFNEFEQTYNIISELEDAIFSIAAALRVLARTGMVTNDDISPDGSLTLEFKAMKDIDGPDSTEAGVKKTKMVDTQRTFRPGEMLDLTDEELLGLNITIAKFFHNLFRSVDEYGREQLEGNK
jgi:hypothetical protein